MDIFDNIGAIDNERLVFGHSKSHVEDRPSFGVVDLLSMEHSLDFVKDMCLICDFFEQIKSLGVKFGVSSIQDEFKTLIIDNEFLIPGDILEEVFKMDIGKVGEIVVVESFN
jgi:hypothetical protein